MSHNHALPDAWIEKIFQKFEDYYGSKWAAQYGSFPRDRVKGTWAEELAGFVEKPECIAQALTAQKSSPFPPTLPEFLGLCREALRRIGDDDGKPALQHKRSPEEKDRSAEIAKRISEIISPMNRKRDGIDYFWGTHPKGYLHLKFIFEASANDSRFLPCVAEMVEKGICTAQGKLLKRYKGQGEWEQMA